MSDPCQTPGCGHAPHWHRVFGGEPCFLPACPCARYTAPTETVSEDEPLCRSCNDEGCDHCCPVWKGETPPTREQVLADAESAWLKWCPTDWRTMTEVREHHSTFIAGYLAGKGLTMTAAHLDLEALREVVDAATDLPWEVGEIQDFTSAWYTVHHADVEPNICAGADPADAALIVAAVNALPVLIDALEEARGETINVAGGALIEEAEQRTRRIHAEVERDVARQALVSADAMNRLWDELNAERDLLTADRDRLREEVRALLALINPDTGGAE